MMIFGIKRSRLNSITIGLKSYKSFRSYPTLMMSQNDMINFINLRSFWLKQTEESKASKPI
jgi:hypothetical protein